LYRKKPLNGQGNFISKVNWRTKMGILYRELRKSDFDSVKNMINESFGLYRYVDNESVLKSFLNVYLSSCLSEKTFSCVSEKDGKVIGVIMGNAKCDYSYFAHLKPIFAMAYHSVAMAIKAIIHKNDNSDYKRMHQIYHELLAGSGQEFSGVLTLFAVSEECRGFGVGKELLHRLLTYQKERETSNIYLYTDSTCNYGFYESQGFKRLGEKTMQITRDHKIDTLDVYLYEYKIK